MEEMFCCITNLRLGIHEPKMAILAEPGKGGKRVRFFADANVFFHRLPEAKKWSSVRSAEPVNDGVTHILDLAVFSKKATAEQAEQLILACGSQVADCIASANRLSRMWQARA